MFFHKSKSLTTGFACAAAAMIISVAANPAQADYREAPEQGSYCGEGESCKYPTGGIVQKELDGVNYFYGGFHAPSPSLSYVYVLNRNLDQPDVNRLDERMGPWWDRWDRWDFEAPLFRNQFRLNKDNRRFHRRFRNSLEFPVGRMHKRFGHSGEFPVVAH